MNKNNNAADQPICARCARRFPTCCRLGAAPNDVETQAAGQAAGGTANEAGSQCFPLFPAEISRLEAAKPSELASTESLLAPAANSPEFLEAMLALFPDRAELLQRLYPPGQNHWRMALRPDGSCVCLGEQGCLLPQAARPRFCRLFPFWLQRGRLVYSAPPDCLAVLENRTPRSLLRVFGLEENEVRQRYRDLCQDWNIT